MRLLLLVGSLALLGAGCVRATPPAGPPPGGIYRSDDGGVSFRQVARLRVGAPFTGKRALRDLSRVTAQAVALSAAAPDTVYVVAVEGLFRTTTAGESWERLPLRADNLQDLDVHPRNPDILLAAGTSTLPPGRGKIVKSLTGGDTWAEVYTAPAAVGEVGTIVRRRRTIPTSITSLAHDPLQPHVILAGTNTGALLRSTDGGIHWRTARTFSQGITGLEFSPTRPGLVLIRLTDGQLARSTDGGATADRVRLRGARGPALGFAPGASSEVVRAVLFTEAAKDGHEGILVGSEEGLFHSRDGGDTWETLPLPPAGATPTPVTSLTEGADGTLWATSGFVLFSSTDGGRSWRATDTPLPTPIRFVVADPTTAGRLYLLFAPS